MQRGPISSSGTNTLVSTAAYDIPDDILFTLGNDSDIAQVLSSSAINVDTALTGVIEGTTRRMATAVDSLLISNVTNDGDMQFLVSDGGSSWGMLTFNGDDHSAHFGRDDWGVPVTFYGASASHYLKWDEANDDLVLAGDASTFSVDSIVDSSSTVTGSIHTDGGVGIAKKLYVGTTLDVAGTSALDGAVTCSSHLSVPQGSYIYLDGQGGDEYIYSNAAGKITIVASGTSTDDIRFNGSIYAAEGIWLDGGQAIRFYEFATYIHAPSSGKLEIVTSSTDSDALLIDAEATFKHSSTYEGSANVIFWDVNSRLYAPSAGKLVVEATSTDSDAILIDGKTKHKYNSLYEGSASVWFWSVASRLYAPSAGKLIIEATSTDQDAIEIDAKTSFKSGSLYEGASNIWFYSAASKIYAPSVGKLVIQTTSTAADAITLQTGLNGSITLQNCYLGLRITDTDSSTEGEIWYDNSENTIKVCTGSKDSVVLLTATQELTNKILGAVTLNGAVTGGGQTISNVLIADVGGQAYNDWTATALNASSAISLRSASDTAGTISIYTYSTTASTCSSLRLYRSDHDTVGSHGAVEAADVLGCLEFWGSDGDSYGIGAYIRGTPTETWNDTSVGTKIMFYTAPDTTLTPLERLTVDQDGSLILGKNEGGDGSAPAVGNILRATDIVGGTTANVDGSDLTFSAGLGTGTGDAGTLIFQLPEVVTAGTTIQTRATVLTMDMVASTTAMSFLFTPDTTLDCSGTLTLGAVTLSGGITGGDQAFTAVGNMTFTDGSIIAAIDGAATSLIFKSGGLTGTTFITLNSVSGGTDNMVLGKTFFYDAGGEYIQSDGSNLTIAGAVIFPSTVYFYDAGGESISSNGSMLTIAGAISFSGSTIVTADSATIEIGAAGVIKSGGTAADTLLLAADDTTFITFTTGATDECEIESVTMKGTWLADGTVTFPAITAGGLITSTSTTGFRSNPTFAPDATYTNYALAVGAEADDILITFAQDNDQNLDLIQFNIDVDSAASGTGPTNSSQMNLIHGYVTHDTDQMALLRMKGMDMTITSAKNCKAIYAYQGEIDLTATQTITDEATILGLVMNASGGTITAGVRGIVIAMDGASLPSTNSMGLFIATGQSANLYDGIYIETQGGTSIENSIRLGSAVGTTIACGLNIGGAGTFTNDISFQEDTTLTDDGTSLTLAGANFVGTMGALTLAGAVNCASQAMTNVNIDSGAIDGVTIGGAAAPTVTDLGSVATCDLNAGTIGGMTIDGTMTMGDVGFQMNESLGTDNHFSGITCAGVAGCTTDFGDILYLATADDRWELAQADSESTTGGNMMLGINVTTAQKGDGDAFTLLLVGFVRDDTAFEFTSAGVPLYLSDTAAGDFIETKPDTTNDIVRIIGYAHDDKETVFFNPDGAYVTIA